MTYRADLAKQLWSEIQEAPGRNTEKAWERLNRERITSTYKADLNKSLVNRGRFLEKKDMEKKIIHTIIKSADLSKYANLEHIQEKSGVTLLKENVLKLLNDRREIVKSEQFQELTAFLSENTDLTVEELLKNIPHRIQDVFTELIKMALKNPGKYAGVTFDDEMINLIVSSYINAGGVTYEVSPHSIAYAVASTTKDQELIQRIFANDKGEKRWGREQLCYNPNTPVDILESIYKQVLNDGGHNITNSVLEGLSYEKRKEKATK